jgi:enterochelin esterase-like enzyme
MKVGRTLCVLLLFVGGVSGQSRNISYGSPIDREIQSGEEHEYTLSAGAGDLVGGTFELRRLAGIVEISTAANMTVRTTYFFESERPAPQRIGFVAPVSGTYRVQIKAFDRFGGGDQIAPGEPVPVVGTASGSYTLRLDDMPVAVRMRGVAPPVREDYPSARLRRLTQELQTRQGDALRSFWQEVAGKGPLVEEIPGNDREVDVTFLWRATYDVQNVLVLWAGRIDDGYMSRLPGTDVWYKTVRLRRGTRIDYRISPNDRAADRGLTAQLDPLNPRKYPEDPTYRFVSWSVLDMPGAPDEQWALRTPVRRGRIDEKTFTSALLKNQRQIWIYTPPGYTPTAGPYPLVILLDGGTYVSSRFLAAPATFDNLINDGRIRPTVVCFDPGNRGNAAGLAGAGNYGDALVQELMPMLRSSYAITTHPADVVIGGFSAGGRAAAQIAFGHPEVFGNVLSQSGAFREHLAADEPNTTARVFVDAPRKPIRFYLEVGLYDNVPGADGPLYELSLDETNLTGNRHLRDVLRAKGYDVTYREVGGGHENVHWRAMLSDGLMALLGRKPE